jgi:hypothetical protein
MLSHDSLILAPLLHVILTLYIFVWVAFKVQDVVLLDDEDVEPNEEVNREMFDRL